MVHRRVRNTTATWVRTLATIVTAGAPLIPTPAPGEAQLPESFTNLQVLPDDISRPELVGFMRGFSFATGLRCSGCHLGEEGQPFSEYDFAADDRPTKRKARAMLRMVRAINDEHLAMLPDRSEPNVSVTCATCHGGIQRPEPIESVVTSAIVGGGVDAALERYRALRRDYHGTRAYDFGERPLIEAAGQQAQGGATEEAVALLELNAEYFPESGQTYTALGETHRTAGNTEAALAAYRRALEINPDNPVAARWIRELGGR